MFEEFVVPRNKVVLSSTHTKMLSRIDEHEDRNRANNSIEPAKKR